MEKFNSKNLYNDLRAQAAAVGCSLSDICETAKVPRNTVQNWSKKPPRSFVILESIQNAIEAKRISKDLAANE